MHRHLAVYWIPSFLQQPSKYFYEAVKQPIYLPASDCTGGSTIDERKSGNPKISARWPLIVRWQG